MVHGRSASQLREPLAEGADSRVVSMLAQVLPVECPDPSDVLPRSEPTGERQRVAGTARALDDLTLLDERPREAGSPVAAGLASFGSVLLERPSRRSSTKVEWHTVVPSAVARILCEWARTTRPSCCYAFVI